MPIEQPPARSTGVDSLDQSAEFKPRDAASALAIRKVPQFSKKQLINGIDTSAKFVNSDKSNNWPTTSTCGVVKSMLFPKVSIPRSRPESSITNSYKNEVRPF